MRRGPRRWREPELCGGCRETVPRAGLCDACWGRLPECLRAQVRAARESRAAHLVSAAVRSAAAWLRVNTPAAIAARMIGERD